MKTELHDIGPVKKLLKVEVGADVVSQARAAAMQELQKKAQVQGFRQGKVPQQILEQKFGQELQHETIEKIVDLTLMQALNEAKVYPVSRPELTPGLWQGSGGYNYTVTFEVLPEIKLKPYKGLKLEKTEVAVNAEELKAEMTRLQAAMTQLEPLPEGAVLEKGHVAKIDFEGDVEGKKFEGSSAKDHMIELGTGGTLAEFESAILGAKIGEARAVQFDYPKDYFNKDLAGKKASFQVTLKEIRKKNVPKLDDDFAKDLGEFKTIKDVEEDLKKRIAAAKENAAKEELCNQITKQLVDENKFEVPESLVAEELKFMLRRFVEEMKRRGQKVEDLKSEEVINHFKPQAEFRVRSYLLLNRVAEDGALKVTEEEVNNRLNTFSKGLNKPLAEVRAYYEKNKLLGSLETQILHEKALEFVLNQAKIKVVKPKSAKKESK